MQLYLHILLIYFDISFIYIYIYVYIGIYVCTYVCMSIHMREQLIKMSTFEIP